MYRKRRIKTQNTSMVSQLQRQKSIFSNLSWQLRQKDKKIIFLERYFEDLQRIINKEQVDDQLLREKVEKEKRKKMRTFVYRYPTEVGRDQYHSHAKNRLSTQQPQREEDSNRDKLYQIKIFEK